MVLKQQLVKAITPSYLFLLNLGLRVIVDGFLGVR